MTVCLYGGDRKHELLSYPYFYCKFRFMSIFLFNLFRNLFFQHSKYISCVGKILRAQTLLAAFDKNTKPVSGLSEWLNPKTIDQ